MPRGLVQRFTHESFACETVDDTKTQRIEEQTRTQSESQTWKDERKFRITASDFHRVKIRKRNHGKLSQDMLSLKSFSTESTKHGLKYESTALREYGRYMERSGKPLKVLCSGLCVSKKHFILGGTPDARIVDPGCREQFGIAEVKCPHSKFSVNPLEACSDPSFCLEDVGGILTLKTNHAYYDQVQGQVGLTGASWCDFIVYTRKGLAITRIAFDEQHWSTLREKLCQYYFKYFLPLVAKS
ncbi:uncharacterized protein LOC111332254 [Stylophora pistillata]|uniref:uncharacterized protein LOC111332254 n=1 Tax=Stylophora pistillata TaxID=50429 RepID=UPI000C04C7C4|nr:uncharacterized protein LOC111332254 [Stylophora pistillata]